MANSRIMLVCKHCGGEMVLGKGYLGSYSCCENKADELNAFFAEHECGICADEADCSDNARNHFVILEEGETLDDISPKSEVALDLLSELKKDIHNKAVFPGTQDVHPYISLKVLDGIIQKYINRYYEEEKKNDN